VTVTVLKCHGSDSKVVKEHRPMSVAALSMYVCSRLLAGVSGSNPTGVVNVLYFVWVAGSNPTGVVNVLSFVWVAGSNPTGVVNVLSFVNILCCVGGLCNGPIPCPGKFYWMYVLLSVIKRNTQLLHLQRIDTNSRTKNRK
jgi:hypothetical protein